MAKYKAKIDEGKKNNIKNTQKSKTAKRIKKEKIENENIGELKRFLVILAIVIVLVIGIYFLSILIKKDDSDFEENTTAGQINYTKASVGTILNRPYDEYYVIIYDVEDSKAVYYSTLITSYQSKSDAKKLYFVDLNNSLNSSYKSKDNKGNSKATKIDDFSFGELTLIKVKDGKVASYYENLDDIKKILK